MKLLTFPPTLKRLFKRTQRHLVLSKRQEFVVVTVALTTGLLLTQLVSVDLRYPMVIALSVLAYSLCAIALREDLAGIEWVTLLVLPTLFTAGVSLFYFLLPVRWLTRVPAVAGYAIGMYALLLTENIYNVNVSSDRSIALIRAAHSVGFILTLVSYFLLLQTILAFRLQIVFTTLLVGMVSFVLTMQALWAIELGQEVSRRVVYMGVALTLFLMELAWVFGFWPVKSTLVSLFLATCFYSSVGLAQQYLVEKLYKKTIIEFSLVSIIVFMIVLAATRWRGVV